MIRIEIDDRQVQSALGELARRGADLAPALADIGEYLARISHSLSLDERGRARIESSERL